MIGTAAGISASIVSTMFILLNDGNSLYDKLNVELSSNARSDAK
jgi:hypothetical protein